MYRGRSCFKSWELKHSRIINKAAMLSARLSTRGFAYSSQSAACHFAIAAQFLYNKIRLISLIMNQWLSGRCNQSNVAQRKRKSWSNSKLNVY